MHMPLQASIIILCGMDTGLHEDSLPCMCNSQPTYSTFVTVEAVVCDYYIHL